VFINRVWAGELGVEKLVEYLYLGQTTINKNLEKGLEDLVKRLELDISLDPAPISESSSENDIVEIPEKKSASPAKRGRKPGTSAKKGARFVFNFTASVIILSPFGIGENFSNLHFIPSLSRLSRLIIALNNPLVQSCSGPKCVFMFDSGPNFMLSKCYQSVIVINFIQTDKSQRSLLFLAFVYLAFHLLTVISYELTQSDNIKQFLLYWNKKNIFSF
jgi:hypothetical protein